MNKYTIFIYLVGMSNFPLSFCDVEASNESEAIVFAKVQYAEMTGASDSVHVGLLFAL